VTVDVTLEGALPRGAVPDLTVDGVIELERLESALQVGRPANAQEDSELTLFRLNDAGDAERVRVKVGRSSVAAIQVLDGLNADDRVVVSDMSAWDGVERITFR
jgi:HlyD family secretion protein